MRPALVVLAALLAITAAAGGAPRRDAPPPKPARRWVYVPTNLYVNENLVKVEALLRRAKAASYNGVLFADYKTGFFWTLDDAARWKTNAGRLRTLTRELGLTLAAAVMPFGYSGSLLTHDPNLAAGLPLRDVPLVARGGLLVPERTAEIRNGSFEEHRGHVAAGFPLQDRPGVASFIDEDVAKDGRVSLRFEDVGRGDPHGHGRVSQEVAVRPWQQYRLRVWVRTEALTADEVRIAVLAGGRSLQFQHLSIGASPRNLTADWTEETVAFNSLGNEKVLVYLGLWGGKTGRIWWDGLRIDPAPALNLLRRESLPLAIAGEDGTALAEGRDFEPLADPLLGGVPYAGNYDTRHEPPTIRLRGRAVRDGARYSLSGWHAAIVYDGQVGMSLLEPRVFDLCAEEVRRLRETLDPDLWFLSHDEIRCGGFEPAETAGGRTAGQALAENIRRCAAIARKEGGGKPVAVWSDMFDPAHNARADYYLVNNTLAGSWEGLDPKILIMKWGGGAIARPGLEFFSGRGHEQMIAAFYDGDPAADHAMWTEAARGIARVTGVMYTTWRGDYGALERFATLWWGD